MYFASLVCESEVIAELLDKTARERSLLPPPSKRKGGKTKHTRWALAWKGRFLNSPWVAVETVSKLEVHQRWCSCLQGSAVTAINDGLLKHCWQLGDALALHWEWELSSSQTWDHSVHMLWLPVALTLRLKTHTVELWEISLSGQSYSSCKDLDFFPRGWAKISNSER